MDFDEFGARCFGVLAILAASGVVALILACAFDYWKQVL